MNHKSRRHLHVGALTAILIGLLGPAAMACRIPVFRYALERWAPDAFDVTVSVDGKVLDPKQSHAELNEEQQQALQKLSSIGLHQANVRLGSSSKAPTAKDADETDADEIGTAGPAKRAATSEPQMTVQLTRRRERTREVWQAPLNLANVEKLIDSPLRKKISQRLLDGESAVWVLIESGNKDQDDLAASLIKQELANMAETIKLPDQSELEAESEFIADSSVDLRIDFSLVRLSRNDAKETAFLGMLLASESDLHEFNEPIAIPVYGRGRTYYALVGKGIRAELIAENCRFICGDCSCQVKEENPGSDLLFSVDWNAKVRGSAIPERELPPVTGIGSLEIIDLGTVEDMQAEKKTRTNQQVAPTKTTEANSVLPASTTDNPPAALAPTNSDELAKATDANEEQVENAADPTPVDTPAEPTVEPAPVDAPAEPTLETLEEPDEVDASTLERAGSASHQDPVAVPDDPSVAEQQTAAIPQAVESKVTTMAPADITKDTASVSMATEQTKSKLMTTLLALTLIAAAVVFVVGYLIRQ